MSVLQPDHEPRHRVADWFGPSAGLPRGRWGLAFLIGSAVILLGGVRLSLWVAFQLGSGLANIIIYVISSVITLTAWCLWMAFCRRRD